MPEQLDHEHFPSRLSDISFVRSLAACLACLPAASVEALCQRSGVGLQFSVCFKRQGVCLAEKRCLWSARYLIGPRTNGGWQCTVSAVPNPEEEEATRPEQRGGGRGSSFATSEQTAVPRTELGCDCATGRSWMDLPVTPGQCTGHGRGGRAGSWQAAEEGEEEQGNSRANRMRSTGGSHRWSASCAS